MKHLHTSDAVALHYLFHETLFTKGLEDDTAQSSFEQPDKKALEVAPAEEKTDTADEEPEFLFRGSIDKGVLFLLRNLENDYLSPNSEDAFTKSLSAVGLVPEQVAMMNLANKRNANDFKRIMTFFNPKKIILLGIAPATLALPHIETNAYMRGRIATVFNTFSFEEMFVDIEKKKAFWGEFKKFMKEG